MQFQKPAINDAPLVLIIDDEEAILKTLKDILLDEHFCVETLSQGQNAIEVIGSLLPDVILLDIFMPNCNGLELLTTIKKEFPHQNIIMISGFGNIPIAIEAIQKGARDFIEKPLNLDEILNKLEFLRQSPVASLIQTHKPFSDEQIRSQCGLIGQSNLFLELIHQAQNLAPHKFPILIYGEQGVGKTTIARYIHRKSSYAQDPFVVYDCQTLHLQDPQLSQLANTLVQPNQILYLHHIDLLEPSHQNILVSLLEKIETKPHARIIASSNTMLFNAIQNNTFNAALFYHFNRAPIEIPPLRNRRYDIPLLLHYYLDYFNKEYKTNIILSVQNIRILCGYEWQENITQLKNTIHSLVANNNADTINPTTITTWFGEKDIQVLDDHLFDHFSSLDEGTLQFERAFLLYLLRKNHYNLKQLSDRLSISPLELKEKFIKHKIDVTTNFVFEGVDHE